MEKDPFLGTQFLFSLLPLLLYCYLTALFILLVGQHYV